MRSVLLHPSYFPTIAHMVAAAQADRVIFEMHDNYQKQTYRNRAYIAHAQGKLLLNVPVKHSQTERQKTSEINVETNFPWQSQHLKSLQTAYRTSPFFEFYEDELLEIFTRPVTHLMEHNLFIFNILCELIGLSVEVDFTEEYKTTPELTDGRDLIKARKGLKFEFEPYTQVFIDKHGFLPNLSVLDLLFNQGPDTLSYLEQQQLF
ncbi:MAG: hypothetical protein HKM28_01780 [Flavobacteriaceae bacterium]|nr:hypothetical protein [Flavobacteriaceae bacterium]